VRSDIDKAICIGISSGRDTSGISSTLLTNFKHSSIFFLGKDLISELKVASFGSGGGGWGGEKALGKPCSSMATTTLAAELQSYGVHVKKYILELVVLSPSKFVMLLHLLLLTITLLQLAIALLQHFL
jgi:hypothetical protein